jgi:soluble lytic murein transglycosylase-like protein
MEPLIIDALRDAARSFGLDPLLVRALVEVESGGDPYAWNPEPGYRYFWDVRKRQPFRPVTAAEVRSKHPPADFVCLAGDPDQEWWGQQVSWGLMQVMGAVARERGFRGRYLPQLCAIASNLTYGCGHLAVLLAWARNDQEQALAAYNGGRGGNSQRPFRNAAYAAKVLAAQFALTNPHL